MNKRTIFKVFCIVVYLVGIWNFANAGQLVYSTYLGGVSEDNGRSIAIDSSGNAYITGYTSFDNFPTTLGAFDTTYNGSFDVFVTKLNASGTALAYSTYLGGGVQDYGYGIAVDSSENAYITGYTLSSDFPVTARCIRYLI